MIWLLGCADAVIDSVDYQHTGCGSCPEYEPADLLDPGAIRLSAEPVGTAPSGTIPVCATGDGEIPFTLWAASLDLDQREGSVRGGECVHVGVSYAGPVDEPIIVGEVVTLEGRGRSFEFPVSGAILHPDLPAADWTTDPWGTWTIVDLPSAPFPDGVASYTDSSVLVWRPLHPDDDGPIDVITHFHGHNAHLSEVLETMRLREQVSASGRDAILIVPQGPYEAADSDFGRLDEPGGHAALVTDAIGLAFRDEQLDVSIKGQVALTAHSGGYNVVANVIEDGGMHVDVVHLFDALYAREDTFYDFAMAGGTLRSVYTSGGGTDDENLALRDRLEASDIEVGSLLEPGPMSQEPVTIGYSSASHGGCVVEDAAFGRWLEVSGLAMGGAAVPRLVFAIARDGVETLVAAYGLDEGDFSMEYSSDGEAWSKKPVSPATFVRARGPGAEAEPSDVYGATGTDWLIVDGFDRTSGSYDRPTHDFAAQVGVATGEGFSVVSHDRVDDLDLGDFGGLIWILGDESTDDITFTDDEQEVIRDYLDQGGRIVVSGSEVGYASDGAFLEDVLHASYVSDDAGSSVAGGYRFGTEYEEDYPDVLSGSTTIWRYDTGGAAAVGHDERIVVVGFGIENIDAASRAEAVQALTGWLR